ncbi:TRAP transporter substrate-binding protein [Brachybacterium sp. YJGR34]|uniref:TRAP transporter substrate-binding protein n=1 Tax=Brachybacterium sp. YJGR34 TaxID=2059911 RepID=UPI000E0BFA59|nr:TRAP transporter substrate-binding protein [Brachybacterium sp. YJGR34]
MRHAARPPRPGRRALLAAPLALAAGCTARGAVTDSAEADPQSPLILRLAHNLSDTHPTSAAITAFAESVAETSGGRIQVDIYANGQLGSETAVLGQLVQGIVDITRVASPGLATYHAGYHTFGLPYVFDSEEQMHTVMDSAEMTEFYRSTEERGFVGLTHYTSGARSFYTASTPIRTPEDVTGMKIRVQDMRSQTELMETLDGAPVVMAFGDTYTALQTGLIDGAESNETVLTDSAHGEVAKVFSRTRHTIIPDLMLISSEAWQKLAPEDQELVAEAAHRSSLDHREAWVEAIEAAEAESVEMGVEFLDDIDLEAFRTATRPVVDDFAAEYPEVAEVLTVIETASEETS